MLTHRSSHSSEPCLVPGRCPASAAFSVKQPVMPTVVRNSNTRMDSACALLGLPEDCLIRIGQFLSVQDLCTLELCCRTLHRIGHSHQIWTQHIQAASGAQLQVKSPESV